MPPTLTWLPVDTRVDARLVGLKVYVCAYGQYLQELLDNSSTLHSFKPDVCCLVLDEHHLAELGSDAALDACRLAGVCVANIFPQAGFSRRRSPCSKLFSAPTSIGLWAHA
jgi:hypothetical protein